MSQNLKVFASGLQLSVAAARALAIEPTDLVQRWLQALSPSTRRSYRRSLKCFTKWALPQATDPIDGLRCLISFDNVRAREIVRRWRDDLASSGLASSSVGQYVTAIVSITNTARRAGLCDLRLEDVMPKIEPVRDLRGPRKAEIEQLIKHVDEMAAKGDRYAVRDSAIIRLLYVGAFRRSEVVSIRLEDFGRTDAGVMVRIRRKGQKERTPVLITERTATSIAAWIDLRGTQPGPLFVRLKGRRPDTKAMEGETVRRLLATWAKRAGIQSPVRPHGLRHSAATTCAREGNIAALVQLGGWASLASAKNYIDHYNEDRQAAMRTVDL